MRIFLQLCFGQKIPNELIKIWLTEVNEMVSLGDTAISLHILQLNLKCQDLPKFQFPWEGRRGFCTKSQNRVFLPIWAKILSCHSLEGLGSQIVCHILRMWRLINDLLLTMNFRSSCCKWPCSLCPLLCHADSRGQPRVSCSWLVNTSPVRAL